MRIGLRVDVDTFRGTKLGVPNLCRLFAGHSINASFFFSVGPDNMGRHLWRLLRPKFLFKMLRTKAARLYGWDILFKGTFWPGPVIGKKLADVIRSAAEAGHEVGLHAWDHHAWQAHIDTMDAWTVHQSLSRGVDLLTKILGSPPVCSAVPGWKCNDLVLTEKRRFPFRYNSDCRGDSIFRPLVDDKQLAQPQIPVTLPTYDEMIGHHGVTESNYNDRLLAECSEDRLNVLTIHAEVEGIACFEMFDKFLKAAEAQGISFLPLGVLLDDCPAPGSSGVVHDTISGREGWVAWQETSKSYHEQAG
ncbi:MAG TPA: 4-deoxy-4-formamido-L-arabinose-phosphoundecaprenol deformylase [Phycisphaerales bacterium]|nr:4-deoxy-4-formamido-L-arabinose-phosphoundecaprenol deformylase [Phycisphaerales bacterium]